MHETTTARRGARRLRSHLRAVGQVLAGGAAFVGHGTQWGSTDAERAMTMPGDADGDPSAPVVLRMTRAISIERPPEVVWPWLAQFGRGAGWYSIDGVDNGGRTSARHIVSWIPEPRVGDAAGIGYLRRLEPGHALTWFMPPVAFLSARMSMCIDMHLGETDDGARLVCRVTSAGGGRLARLATWLFAAIDSIMFRKVLLGVRERAEAHGRRTIDPDLLETGARDQFQLYETIFAAGERAGVPGREGAAAARKAAIAAGVLAPAEDPAG